MPPPALSLRALNRATLVRQYLLERADVAPLDAVRSLVGLQAQEPPDPYVALWSRLRAFDPGSLSALLEARAVVRIVVMRGTIHLVTAEDALVLRPMAQPVLDRELQRHRDFALALQGVDLEPVLAEARQLLTEPRTTTSLRAALAERFPGLNPGALAYACRNHLALVQAPPRGLWRRSGGVRVVTAEAWLGRKTAARVDLGAIVRRYLAAFGPSTPGDFSVWSGLPGGRELFASLGRRLRRVRDERGRELFDVPDGPHPDPDTPAPVRFLPTYDNLLLSHADRSRFMEPGDRGALGAATATIPRVRGTVLVDGRAVGLWTRDVPDEIVVHLRRAADDDDLAEIDAEGRRLGAFLGQPDVVVRVRPVT